MNEIYRNSEIIPIRRIPFALGDDTAMEQQWRWRWQRRRRRRTPLARDLAAAARWLATP